MSLGLTLVKLWVTVCPAVGEPAVQPGAGGQLNITDALATAGASSKNAATIRQTQERLGLTIEPLLLIGSAEIARVAPCARPVRPNMGSDCAVYATNSSLSTLYDI